MKLGRNDTCHCGSGFKYKKCCLYKDKMKSSQEKSISVTFEDFQKSFVGKDFDELDVELEDFEEDPSFSAQQLVYDAWEMVYKKDRVQQAKVAIKLWPDCADAFNILAEDLAKAPDQKIKYYEKAIQAGKRAIGDKRFREARGHFWGMIETRPFMRAKFGLASALWEKGESETAISHLWEMLDLNPGDNQGIRYVLVGWLFLKSDFVGVKRILKKNEDEGSATFAYSRLLQSLIVGESQKVLHNLFKIALSRNAFIPDFIVGNEKIPKKQASGYSSGSREEAIMYGTDCSGILSWQKYPVAVKWLKENKASKGQVFDH
jgi:tetratricopeptide (TPR) repeat protein